jgi:hypothetical protein
MALEPTIIIRISIRIVAGMELIGIHIELKGSHTELIGIHTELVGSHTRLIIAPSMHHRAGISFQEDTAQFICKIVHFYYD